MNRRQITKLLLLGTILHPVEGAAKLVHLKATKFKEKKFIRFHPLETSKHQSNDDDHIKDYLTKIRHPNRPHHDDIILSESDFQLLERVVSRFVRIRSTLGHGHFCVIDFDEALKASKRYSRIGRFSKRELSFLEYIFYQDAAVYGFKGNRQLVQLTDTVKQNSILKIPYSGNYLFNGDSLAKFESLKKEIGTELVLTSGIRGIIKQFHLFLSKAYRYNGNLSLASRSLAPPGYSYHATGDFDVGQKGFGGGNFSIKFTSTPVFQTLAKQGYVEYRYQKDNMLGVRYEPWHIKL